MIKPSLATRHDAGRHSPVADCATATSTSSIDLTTQPNHRRFCPPGLIARCVALLAVSVAGCSNLTSPARQHALDRRPEPYWFDYAAERRGAFLVPHGSDGGSEFILCAEPFPDVAMKHTTELALAATTPEGISADIKAKLASDVVQLAGRTQMVLFLRESMYRLCEQSFNGNLKPDEIAKLYNVVIDAALALSKATLAGETAAALKAAPDLRTRETIQNFLDSNQE